MHAARRPLGDHRQRMCLAALVGGTQPLGDVRGLQLVLGQRDHLGAARDTRHERDVAAIASHRFDSERALVR